MVREGMSPTNQEILDRARRVEADTFARRWSPNRVADVLRRYGPSTTRTMHHREYRPAMDAFKAIERNYAFDLNADGEQRIIIAPVRSHPVA